MSYNCLYGIMGFGEGEMGNRFGMSKEFTG
jgi:hypothetical protein